MDIKFDKFITKPGQDGFGFLFNVNGKKFEIQISDSALGAFKFPDAKPISDQELYEYVNFEQLINDVVDIAENQKIENYKVILTSNGVTLLGKIIYSREKLKDYVKVAWIG